eukprot:scaffold133172_cov21-Tisochrysis_lutea.AAC.1
MSKEEIGHLIGNAKGVPKADSFTVTIESGSVIITTTLNYQTQQTAKDAGIALTPLVVSASSLETFLFNGGINVNVTQAPSVKSEGTDGVVLYEYNGTPPSPPPSPIPA